MFWHLSFSINIYNVITVTKFVSSAASSDKINYIKFRKAALHNWAKRKYIASENKKQKKVDASFLKCATLYSQGKNEKANRYLREAALEIRHALSDLSDALFELTTSPEDIDDDNDLGWWLF